MRFTATTRMKVDTPLRQLATTTDAPNRRYHSRNLAQQAYQLGRRNHCNGNYRTGKRYPAGAHEYPLKCILNNPWVK